MITWTYETSAPPRRVIVEVFEDAVSLLVTGGHHEHIVLTHLDPDDAEVMASALLSAARRARAESKET